MINLHNNSLGDVSDIHSYFDNITESIPASIYWKDKKGLYLRANNALAKSTVKSSCEDIVGFTDYDLSWKDEAFIMQKNDNEVIYTGQSKTVIEPAKTFQDNKTRLFLSHKSPLRLRTGKIIGTFGLSFVIDDKVSVPANLFAVNPAAGDNKANYAYTFGLTERQIECLFNLVKGMTIKQIAKTLSLSPRTVEHYLDTIKQKLNCESRVELISKALQLPAIRKRL